MLAFEAEAVITMLPIQEQDSLQYQIAHNLERLFKQQKTKNFHTIKTNREKNNQTNQRRTQK
jgi:hypothetical protein